MHDPKLSYYIGCHYLHRCISVHKSFNHPIVDFRRQVHGFTSVIFVHINPVDNRGVVVTT
jgi:hypothetical protein